MVLRDPDVFGRISRSVGREWMWGAMALGDIPLRGAVMPTGFEARGSGENAIGSYVDLI